MHWTALLAYRRFPPEARVIDDVACIHCGYNLRGARAMGSCPECGGAVGDSLFVLAQPAVVARSLRMAGTGYLAVFGLLLGCVVSADWTLIVGTAILALGSMWRMIGLADLYHRGQIGRLPIIGALMKRFCIVALIECIVAIAHCGVTYWVIKTGGPMWLKQDLTFPMLLWLAVFFESIAVAGVFGHALAQMLGYGWMSIELKVQRVINYVATPIAMISIIAMRFSSSNTAKAIALCMFAMALGATVLAICLAFMHLANAAEHNDELREDAIDSSPSG